MNSDDSEPVSGLAIPILTIFTLAMSVLSVPFTYGKCVWNAQMPDVALTTDADEKADHAPTSATPTSPATTQESVFGLLLAADEEFVLIYTTPESMITEYSRSEVKSIRLRVGTQDLVGKHIALTKKDDDQQ